MKIPNIIRPIKNFSSRLTRVGKKEPLHFFSLAIIIALDIFVLINLFQGLYLQKEQLDKPYENIPYSCQNFFLEEEKNTDERRDEELSILTNAIERESYFDNVQNKYASAVEIIENKNKEKVDIRCHELYNKALVLSTDTHLAALTQNIEDYHDKIWDWEQEIDRYEREYDTMLLEKIADQPETKSITEGSAQTIKRRINENKETIQGLEQQVTQAENLILQNAHSQKFLSQIAENQGKLERTLSRLQFWYPLKKILVEMIFLLPLFCIFLWIYRKMLSKESSVLSLIASHLLLVTLIPIVLKVFELLLDIIPFHFFVDLLALLEALNIIAAFNYILIAIGIIFVLGIIYFLQKKVFSAQKTWEKRIQKNQCWSCGTLKSHHSDTFCSFCGEDQFETCSKCNHKKRAHTLFCQECGYHEKK